MRSVPSSYCKTPYFSEVLNKFAGCEHNRDHAPPRIMRAVPNDPSAPPSASFRSGTRGQTLTGGPARVGRTRRERGRPVRAFCLAAMDQRAPALRGRGIRGRGAFARSHRRREDGGFPDTRGHGGLGVPVSQEGARASAEDSRGRGGSTGAPELRGGRICTCTGDFARARWRRKGGGFARARRTRSSLGTPRLGHFI